MLEGTFGREGGIFGVNREAGSCGCFDILGMDAPLAGLLEVTSKFGKGRRRKTDRRHAGPG